MQSQKTQNFTRGVDEQYKLYSPPLMCVGLVTSWSNFSLARNLGRREVFEYLQTLHLPKIRTKSYGLKIPAQVVLLFHEAVVDVANQ